MHVGPKGRAAMVTTTMMSADGRGKAYQTSSFKSLNAQFAHLRCIVLCHPKILMSNSLQNFITPTVIDKLLHVDFEKS